ncbi:hypothetical protein [Streptomyces sp. KMM 9044]|uniref:hypothetical protein n=1 Tax=Streptomyces sp. KMM 9044 TaxID=2744474 RepID=UPI002151741F|nr:hypothetical protein [Streptomyces sp. KMM 9044]WAX79580.1 hypothetical protein HUV60_019800 [Streptomyces sp. KMM 9044]
MALTAEAAPVVGGQAAEEAVRAVVAMVEAGAVAVREAALLGVADRDGSLHKAVEQTEMI